MVEGRRKKDEVRMKKEQRVVERMYTTDLDGLFLFYITKPQSLISKSYLELLICYQIFSSLDLRLYYTNCFVYAFE